jgi:hypothetical protein
MVKTTAFVSLSVGLCLALAACATYAPTPAEEWNRPVELAASTPVLLHDMAIANPPYPRPRYANYLDEPTRFEFRPRHLIIQLEDNGADETEEPAANDGSYLENGILYVDPNQ